MLKLTDELDILHAKLLEYQENRHRLYPLKELVTTFESLLCHSRQASLFSRSDDSWREAKRDEMFENAVDALETGELPCSWAKLPPSRRACRRCPVAPIDFAERLLFHEYPDTHAYPMLHDFIAKCREHDTESETVGAQETAAPAVAPGAKKKASKRGPQSTVHEKSMMRKVYNARTSDSTTPFKEIAAKFADDLKRSRRDYSARHHTLLRNDYDFSERELYEEAKRLFDAERKRRTKVGQMPQVRTNETNQ